MNGFASSTRSADAIFTEFECWEGEALPGWSMNFLGVRTREDFFTDHLPASTEPQYVQTAYPPLNEEYMEWIDLLEAVVGAGDTFTMVELGAGWGRWLVNGAAAAQQRGIDARLVGVEAEPTHFEWLRQHLEMNNVRPEQTMLYKAAVAAADGTVGFHVGDPRSWYGQAIAELPPEALHTEASGSRDDDERAIVAVDALSLDTILDGLDRVDLVDADIQGAEAEVMESAAATLDRVVKRVHIGTHSRDNEKRLRSLFRRLRWENINDYPCLATAETPWGPVEFQDGVQTWVNAKLRMQ